MQRQLVLAVVDDACALLIVEGGGGEVVGERMLLEVAGVFDLEITGLWEQKPINLLLNNGRLLVPLRHLFGERLRGLTLLRPLLIRCTLFF